MNVLIFGRGRIADREYLPNMHQLARHLEPRITLQVQCVDKGNADCIDVKSWQNDSNIRYENIDKILILSPPEAHFENLSSVVDKYSSMKLPLPEIYIEKPIYLNSGYENWSKLLFDHADLEDHGFYIDHYRFKDTLTRYLKCKIDILDLIGRVNEIAFVSLEKREFWDSTAFSQGYFLEHGCHLVSMLERAFPGIGELQWVPQQVRDWRVWEQVRRPQSCKGDSACIAFFTLAGGDRFSELNTNTGLTVLIGKGMVDKKVLYLLGERGSVQIWFNDGILVVNADGNPLIVENVVMANSYSRVVESIFSTHKEKGLLVPLRQGLSEQEKIITLRKYFPEHMGRYAVGKIPEEITRMIEEKHLYFRS